MDDQLSFRIPRALARHLRQRAAERGVRKSQVVREALQAYLLNPPVEITASSFNADALVGSVRLDHSAAERDALAAQIRRHNWRE